MPEQTQLSRFDEDAYVAQAKLDQAADQIPEKCGEESIRRASEHTPKPRPNDPPPGQTRL